MNLAPPGADLRPARPTACRVAPGPRAPWDPRPAKGPSCPPRLERRAWALLWGSWGGLRAIGPSTEVTLSVVPGRWKPLTRQGPPEKQTQRDVCTQRETGSRSCGDTSPNPRDKSADPSPGRSRRPSPEPVRWQGSFLLGGGRGSVFVRSKPSTGWRRPTHVMEGHLPPQSAQPAAPGAEARPPGSPLPSLPFPKPQPRDKRAEGPMTEGAGSVGAWPILFHNVIWLL
uniref:Uncharacterized protein n=1 Tax=Rousettus aegyptiacus TaxID=9407 RepID=A0A7J8JFN9_ROUAE|nr:hypothetical protein HJG63_010075 [Rousettus aegyptiacus]